jgi:VWFA-related protein
MVTHSTQLPLQSHVNLVPVRVIVHDARGNVVTDLKESDFQIKQDGRLQVISHFSVETPASLDSQVARGTAADKSPDASSYAFGDANTEAANGAAGKLTLPTRFVALVVDDAHLGIPDMIRVRLAGIRYLNNFVKPNERVALYTVSGQSQVDFTDDRAAIEAKLKSMIPRPVGAFDPTTQTICPQITYYQADLIFNKNDPQALSVALADAQACGGGFSANTAQLTVTSTVQEVLAAGNLSTEYSIRRLDEIVKRISAMPGQRSMVLISPGFLTSTYEYDLSQVIDRATRQNVFINTLDGRGLYTVDPLGDITQDPPVRANGATSALGDQYRVLEQNAQSDVLSNLSNSTGGFYFRNNNDLDAGLRQIASEPAVSYLLAFVPFNLKNDGSFHTIGVKILSKEEKYSVQSRKGFFAPKKGKSPEDLVKQDIEDAVFSQEEQQGLPVQLHLQYFKVDDANAKLSVLAHVDITQVRFEQNEGRNFDDLTIVAALFDRNGNFIGAEEKTLEMRLKDATRERLDKSGVTLKTNFDVKPGGYLVRLVVRDSKAGALASRNGVVEIP